MAVAAAPLDSSLENAHTPDAALEASEVPDASSELASSGGWDDDLLAGALAEIEEAERLHIRPDDEETTV